MYIYIHILGEDHQAKTYACTQGQKLAARISQRRLLPLELRTSIAAASGRPASSRKVQDPPTPSSTSIHRKQNQ